MLNKKNIVIICLGGLAALAILVSTIILAEELDTHDFIINIILFLTSLSTIVFALFCNKIKMLQIIPILIMIAISSELPILSSSSSDLVSSLTGSGVLAIAFSVFFVTSLVFAFLDHKWAKISSIVILTIQGYSFLSGFISIVETDYALALAMLGVALFYSLYVTVFSMELAQKPQEALEEEEEAVK